MPIELSLNDFGLDPKGRKERMQKIASTIVSIWKSEASKALDSTASAYRKAIQIHEVTDKRCVVGFPGRGGSGKKDHTIAMMMEFGMGPGGIGTSGSYDVRKFLLTGGKGKMRSGKNGPYKIVNFRHTKASIERLGGEKAKAVVENANFKASLARPNAKTIWGSRIRKEDIAKFDQKHQGLQRPANVVKKDSQGKNYTAHRHKAHLLRGLVKNKGTYSKGVTQSTYSTFRTASWAGDPWMHPGIKGLNLAEKVYRELPSALEGLL